MKLGRGSGLTGPLLITVILLGAHWSFGVLRSYEAIALAVLCTTVTELSLRRLLTGQSPRFASAYVSGISISILVRSPMLWPYALGAVISIMSKYVLRLDGRHLWNPTNFGICALLFLAPFAVAPLSVQWGNDLWPMLVIWVLGLFTIWQAKRAHITIAYVASVFVFAFVRSLVSGTAYAAEVAPITGPMYQLFALFMITDPKTTVSSPWGAVAVACLVAFVEMWLRLAEIIYAPFYALFLVGPPALLVEMWWKKRTGAMEPGNDIVTGRRITSVSPERS
jgi:Na+-translocating ferredoxin:NAD+ oxidoreductase RnfD subunit